MPSKHTYNFPLDVPPPAITAEPSNRGFNLSADDTGGTNCKDSIERHSAIDSQYLDCSNGGLSSQALNGEPSRNGRYHLAEDKRPSI